MIFEKKVNKSLLEKLEEKEPELQPILKQVDEIITGGKATQNPEKFLTAPSKTVNIDGKKTKIVNQETVLVGTKIKKPRIKKETNEEFLASWGIEKGSIAPKYLEILTSIK